MAFQMEMEIYDINKKNHEQSATRTHNSENWFSHFSFVRAYFKWHQLIADFSQLNRIT